MAAALALLASLLWGSADFLGGVGARRLPSAAVVLGSQGLALIGVVVVAAATGHLDDPGGYAGWAVAAGACGVGAVTAFYAALAEGTMGIVAPVAALGVALPVAVGLAEGDAPTAWQAAGVAVAVVGVVLASGPELRATRAARRPLLLAGLAALGFGAVIVLVAEGARTSTVMTLLVMRAVSAGALAAAGLLGLARVLPRRRDLPLLAAVGAGDVGANALFAVASTRGLLSVVSVLSSLYPVVTALLARLVLGERLARVQVGGVAATVGGVLLIASGGGAG